MSGKLTYILTVLFFVLSLNSYALDHKDFSAQSLIWNQDTLTIGNNLIEAKFFKSWKGLEILSLKNKELNKALNFNPGSSVFSIANLTDSVLSFEFSEEEIEETASSFSYIKAENFISYKKTDVKVSLRLYSNSPMVIVDFFIKKKDDMPEFTPDESSLFNFQLQGKHWLFKSVEFFDRTDQNNTLIQEHEGLSYSQPVKLSGNILRAENLLNQNTLLIVKEAPCSYVQLHWPGYDFYSNNQFLSVRGVGVMPDDLPDEEWIRTYSVALGVSGSDELDFLTTIRRYQKRLRKILPGRDDMIMMNTWGDRNKDASIGEEFIKNEIDACSKLNITHFQIDDGWQKGRSANSSEISNSMSWSDWEKENWQPDPGRFPNGLKVVKDYASEKGIQLGLWFNPSSENEYAKWRQDAEIIIDLYNNYGIKYYKIDGVKLPTKRADQNLRNLLDSVSEITNYNVVFNLDMTADNRGGYFYLYEYGNIFLENRYTDWGNYYPYQTLRNLWQLSKYVPAEKFQIEFLNNKRNKKVYPQGDIFAPSNIPFDYTFAVTMMAQPLAWFEGSNLFDEGFKIAPLLGKYLEVQSEMHSGLIFPIGDEPSGRSWTGFQSILDGNTGYVLIFREYNHQNEKEIELYNIKDKAITFKKILGYGESFLQTVGEDERIKFSLPEMNQFVLYRYEVE